MKALRNEGFVRDEQNHLARVKGPEDGAFKIRRIPGLEVAPEAMWRSMMAAVARHEEETLDPRATLGTAPLNHHEAAAMADGQFVISGYRLVPLKRLFGKTVYETEMMLARLLTDAPLEQMEWEAAWALGDSVLVYIRGSLT